VTPSSSMRVHRHQSRPEGADVNAYIVESDSALVAVDSTLTVTDSRAFRAQIDDLGKPLAAVLVTHAHPDHYGGLTELVAGIEVPIIATAAVAEVIARDDPVKETILRPMFGDDWPRERTFPNQTVADSDKVSFDELEFTVVDLGPGESPADSMWLLDDGTVFAGDPVYNHKHAYLADGFWREWLANIDRLERELPADATLYIGHGEPGSPELFAWQRGYIETFVDAVQNADWSRPEQAQAEVVAKVKEYLPSDDLAFLMELSVEPVAAQMGLAASVQSG
jgi:glyoxylase-like metal-dependent hydrolase (beta-lactamase superfamily II)